MPVEMQRVLDGPEQAVCHDDELRLAELLRERVQKRQLGGTSLRDHDVASRAVDCHRQLGERRLALAVRGGPRALGVHRGDERARRYVRQEVVLDVHRVQQQHVVARSLKAARSIVGRHGFISVPERA